MQFRTPVPFREALDQLRRRRIALTNLGSAELGRLDQSILRAAFFSARTVERDLLARYKARIETLLAPQQVRRPDRVTPDNPDGLVTEGITPAELRTQIKELLAEMGYQPDPAERGTIKDLSSDARIDLVVRTNAEMAANHGYWQQGQDPDNLIAFPAQELYRAEDRKDKRGWVQRWRAAGGKVFPGRAPGLPLEKGFSEGRLIALKDSPVWAGISAFGNPYPPFDFNSGVDVRDIGYREAVELGVLAPGQRVLPQRLEFAANMGDTLTL